MASHDEKSGLDVEATRIASITDQWQALYSARVLEEATNPRNVGFLLDPDAFAQVRGDCGDVMEISIRLDGDHIKQALFLTSGHESAIACASILTSMLQGMSLAQAAKIQADDVAAALGGLPKTKEHCAQLAVVTLHQAIRSWHGRMAEEGEPNAGDRQ